MKSNNNFISRLSSNKSNDVKIENVYEDLYDSNSNSNQSEPMLTEKAVNNKKKHIQADTSANELKNKAKLFLPVINTACNGKETPRKVSKLISSLVLNGKNKNIMLKFSRFLNIS